MKPVSPTRSTIELVDGGVDCAGSPSMGQRRAVEPRRKPMVLMESSLQPAPLPKMAAAAQIRVEERSSFGLGVNGQSWYSSCTNARKACGLYEYEPSLPRRVPRRHSRR